MHVGWGGSVREGREATGGLGLERQGRGRV